MDRNTATNVTPGLCECGCGGRTPLAVQNHTRRGYVKGQPLRFINGHNRHGKRSGPAHPRWNHGALTDSGIHRYVRDHFPKSGRCDSCGAEALTHYASINGHEYTRNREDYAELCPSCHLALDYAEGRRRPRGRIEG